MLEKQNLNISFSQGIDTKTDPTQVIPGKLVSAQNIIFTEGMTFNKRNGYASLGTLAAAQGVGLQTFKNELVAFDGSALNSINPANSTFVNKGNITGVDLNVQSIFRSASGQTNLDSAWSPQGTYCFAWNDSTSGPQWIVTSSVTGQPIIPAAVTIASSEHASNVRVFCIGNYFILLYYNTTSHHLRYQVINSLTGSASGYSPADFATTVNSSKPRFDGCVINNQLYVAFNASDGGGAIRYNYLTSGLIKGTETAYASISASDSIAVFGNNTTSYKGQQLWVAYTDLTSNTLTQAYFIVSQTSFATILNSTVYGNTASLSITGSVYANGGTQGTTKAFVFTQIANTYGYASPGSGGTQVESDYIQYWQLNDLGNTVASGVYVRGIGLTSKSFVYNNAVMFVGAYGSYNSQGFEPTYFLFSVNTVGTVVQAVSAKFAFTNGGGYVQAPAGFLSNVNQLSATQFQVPYQYKDSLDVTQGVLYTQTGVNSMSFTFAASNQYQGIELGNNLNLNGGFLSSYDGTEVTEQDFHLFPEDVGVFNNTTGGSILPNGTYSYVTLYQWTDAQGNLFQSAPSPAVSITVGNTNTNLVTINVPTLRVTSKLGTAQKPVSIVVFRTMPTIATGIYYRVSSITSPTFNDPTVDSVAITDGLADVAGQEVLYTTGGVVEDTGAPAFCSMTNFKNRLFGINSEDRNQLWYSKQTLENTPVEMSDSFTLYIDPRFGVMTCITVMDDKLLIFKNNAIFYMIGDGPDITGVNNDFSEAVFITSAVGCTNEASIILTQDGVMFQSNKGIWLVDRGLGVSYIGAPVEAYNANSVTSAQLIPNTTQVRFTLNNGLCLVYDYFYKQWAVFTNHNAVASVIFENLFTYLTPGGVILQETPGLYSDNGSAISMQLQTSWLSFAGYQGYQRLYRMYLKGQYITAHNLQVTVGYDYNPSNADSVQIVPSLNENLAYASDPFYGSNPYYGGSGYGPKEQFRINVSRQKCQSVQVTIQEFLDPNNIAIGAGLTLEAIGMLIGSKGSYPRIAAASTVST